MVAEYQPATGKYYYYNTDQINSTRVVTDDNGNLVYVAVHDPYRGIDHTRANSFNPELKFSGREQDTDSGLYYFGARYYDPMIYRFLSPDPVIPTDMAIYNPQRWNLYGYYGGNPVSHYEVNGMYYIGTIVICRQYTTGNITYGTMYVMNSKGQYYPGTFQTQEKTELQLKAGTYKAQWTYVGTGWHPEQVYALVLYEKSGNQAKNKSDYIMGIHSGSVDESNGCIIVNPFVMRLLVDLTIRAMEEWYQEFDKAAYEFLFENPIQQIFLSFRMLECYSEYASLFYFWVEILDIQGASPPAR